MGYISILFLITGLFLFLNKQQKHFILIFILILSTNYFGLVEGNFSLGPISLQHGDLALLLIFALIPLRTNTSSKKLKIVQNALLLFFAFLAISIFYDFAVRETSPMQVFRTTRKLGYLMFFFLLNSFEWKDYKNALKFIIIATCVHALFYITQYLFGYSYTAHLDVLRGTTHLNENGGARYSNPPSYLIVVFVIVLFSNYFNKYKLLFVILLLLVIILGQSRGAIISMVSILLLWLFLQKKINLATLIFVPLLGFMTYLLAQSYFPILGERFGHLFNEIALVSEMDYSNLATFFHEGSFIFRWGVTYERFMYVLDDPVRMLLGVGFVPDMDVIRPIFILGTYSPSLPTGFEQYNSVDILFPNIFTRYGLVGSIIYLYLIFKIVAFSFMNRQLLWGKILFTYLCSLVFISLVNETFYNGQNFFFILILLHLIVVEKSRNPIFDVIRKKRALA